MSNANNNRQLSEEALAAIPVLRSLIISEKGTSTVKRILADYTKEEGQALPFRQFGFPSAIEYLKATGQFVLQTHMGETTIFVKPSKDSTHIQKMVAAQKTVPKKKSAYTWNNPQLYQYNRFKVQNGFQHRPQSQQYSAKPQQQTFNNPNNPLKRFFQNNGANYTHTGATKENQPPKPPSVPPKVVPSLTKPSVPVSYAKVPSVKVEPCETKKSIPIPPEVYKNVPPLPTVIPKQAQIRPMPLANNYPVKQEITHSPNPFINDLIVQAMAKSPNAGPEPNSYSSNPFTVNQPPPLPQSYSYQPQPMQQTQIVPSNYYQNPYPTNPFINNQRSPFNQIQQRTQLPPPPPGITSDHVINLLDQQVQLLHESVKDFKNTYQRSRILLQSTLNQEVEMMDAIVRHYQQTMHQQQQSQRAAVDRLNQQLEQLHATCRGSRYGA